MKVIMRIVSICLAASTLLAASVYAADEHDADLIERIKAVGEVCAAGSDCASVNTAASSGGSADAGAAARSGSDIAAKHCAMCHGNPGIPGAPRTPEEWQARVDAKGLDGIVATAISGINAMPPKGMCMDCTDAEMKAAVEALIQ